MKKSYFLKLVFILLFSVITKEALLAQNIRLIDVNKAQNSNPNNSYENTFGELNGVFYFNADDGIHGTEVWRSDGTAEGTRLLKDISPGSGPSEPIEIIASGNNIYFSEFDGTRRGLYVSDGTTEGTKFLVDVETGPNQITDVNGIVYFIVHHNFSEDQLWKTDGTDAGTVMVADLYTLFNFSGFSAGNFKNINGKLLFTLYNDNTGMELYTSDGTAAGTIIVADINPGSNSSYPGNFILLNGLLYFSADNGTGVQLWVTDGSAIGTHLVNNSNGVYVSPSYYFPRVLTVLNNILYFAGTTAASGSELYKYDPSDPANNVSLVKDLNPGSNNSFPGYFTDVNGTLFFVTYQDNTGAQQLWKTNGTSTGTALVNGSNEVGSYYSNLINVNGILMFDYFTNSLGSELWRSDGTNAGTTLVKDIYPGIYSSLRQYGESFSYQNGILLFSASDEKNGSELWKSDGTKAGTVMVKDINHTSTASSYPSGFAAANGSKVVFQARSDKYGNEIWVTNGTDGSTRLLKDLTPGPAESYLGFFTNFKNKTYFDVFDGTGYYLAATDGTNEGTSMIYALDPYSDLVDRMLTTGNLLYFTLFNYSTGQEELWRSDGSSTGTFAIKTGFNAGLYFNPTAVGNTLFFTNYDDATGYELWKSDGTVAGTKLLKDINPGANSSYPFGLIEFNNKLYFAADGSDIGNYYLWSSDGTNEGTTLVKSVPVYGFAKGNGKLFLSGFNPETGFELYVSDGTAAGTKLVKDINPGTEGSSIYTFVSGEKLIYFTADDGTHGAELWKSDGTEKGTFLLKDMTPGIDPSYPTSFVNIHDFLFFTLNDTLWQSNGTKDGTIKVDDITLDGVTSFYNLTGIDDNLYFSAYSYKAGQEVYTAKVSNRFTPSEITLNKSISPQINIDFGARLLTNPVNDQLKFTVNVKNKQAARVLITDASGQVLRSDKQTLSPGTYMFSYDTKAWAQGLYMIRIETTDGSSSLLKALK